MKHLINLAIAAGVFIFTKTYAELISFNSIQISETNLLEQTLVIAFAIQWIAFVPAFILKTEKFYDLTGSLTYLSIFIYCLVATDSIGNLKFSNILVAGSVMIWAMRLGSFLFMRISKDGKDERFNSIKTSSLDFYDMTCKYVGFICLSCFGCNYQPNWSNISNIFIIGFVLFIFGFVIEVIADNQKSRFRSKKENKNSFINEGLWARSRHPNYFGEITLWTGITVMALPAFIGMNYLALFSPIFTYLLLNHVSGIRLLEARGHQKWGHLDAYNKYKKDTPKLIPMIIGKK